MKHTVVKRAVLFSEGCEEHDGILGKGTSSQPDSCTSASVENTAANKPSWKKIRGRLTEATGQFYDL